jgi:hypothetical protein
MRLIRLPNDNLPVETNLKAATDVALSLARQVMMNGTCQADYIIYCNYHGLDPYNFRGSLNIKHEFAKAVIATGSEMQVRLH